MSATASTATVGTVTVSTVTEDRPTLHPAIWSAVAVVLAVVLAWRGYELGQAMKLSERTIPIARLVPLLLGVAGALGGAGLGLLLADIRKTTTTKTTTEPSTEIGAQAAPAPLLTSVIAVAKDLTPGKLLVLLAVVLLSATLFAAEPDTAEQQTSRRGGSSQSGR